MNSDISVKEQQFLDGIKNSQNYTLVGKNLSTLEISQIIQQTVTSLYKDTPLVVTLTAGPASGKTTLMKEVLSLFHAKNFLSDKIITEDYNTTNRIERDRRIREGEQPEKLKDFARLNQDIQRVKKGESIHIPLYEPASGSAIDRKVLPHIIQSHLQFLFVEGDFQPVDNPDYRIYYYLDSATRKQNRITRDVRERSGGSNEAVAKSFDERQKQFLTYTLPHIQKADMVIIVSDIQKSENPLLKYTHTIYLKNKEN